MSELDRTRILIVSPLILVLMLMSLGYWSGRWNAEAQSTIPACGDDATQEQIRRLMLESVEDAFKLHVTNLHEVWMKDDTGQPARAANGIHRGINAYLHGRAAVRAWTLKPC